MKEPMYFRAVGQWYEDFRQTTDAEVKWLLARADKRNGAAGVN
jgi:predicted phosphoribosyltransferase